MRFHNFNNYVFEYDPVVRYAGMRFLFPGLCFRIAVPKTHDCALMRIRSMHSYLYNSCPCSSSNFNLYIHLSLSDIAHRSDHCERGERHRESYRQVLQYTLQERVQPLLRIYRQPTVIAVHIAIFEVFFALCGACRLTCVVPGYTRQQCVECGDIRHRRLSDGW